MEDFWIELFSLPSFVVYGIFGGVGGAIGTLVGSALGRLFKIKWLTWASQILCFVLAIQLPKLIVPGLEKETAVAEAMQNFKSNRLYAIIFRQHPEAELEMKQNLALAINKFNSGESYSVAQDLTNKLVAKYFAQHINSTSDVSIYNVLKENAQAIQKFNSNPELCVNYYLGNPKFKKGEIDDELISKETDLKADVIESSINNPSPLSTPGTLEDLSKILVGSYVSNGFDVSEMGKLEQLTTLPPVQGCKIATDFTIALASLDSKRAAYVFKSLMLLSK